MRNKDGSHAGSCPSAGKLQTETCPCRYRKVSKRKQKEHSSPDFSQEIPARIFIESLEYAKTGERK